MRKGEKGQCTELLAGEQIMSDINVATIQLEGETQKFLLSKKDFKTGSRGYYGVGKMMAGGKNYQVNVQCVEIGSKPKEKKE